MNSCEGDVGCILGRMDARNADGGVGLVDLALGNNTERMLRRSHTISKRSLATVAAASIDLIELYHCLTFPSVETGLPGPRVPSSVEETTAMHNPTGRILDVNYFDGTTPSQCQEPEYGILTNQVICIYNYYDLRIKIDSKQEWADHLAVRMLQFPQSSARGNKNIRRHACTEWAQGYAADHAGSDLNFGDGANVRARQFGGPRQNHAHTQS